MEKSQKNANGERLFVRFTVNNEATVAFYTYDFWSREFEDNRYRITNRSLVGRNFADLQKGEYAVVPRSSSTEETSEKLQGRPSLIQRGSSNVRDVNG